MLVWKPALRLYFFAVSQRNVLFFGGFFKVRMGERSVRIRKVEGSTPFESIKRRIVLNDTAFLFVLGSCFFQYSCPSGCDTSKLLSDDLKNKLYYDGFKEMLYHYSHHKEDSFW